MPIETIHRSTAAPKYRWEIDMNAIRVIGKGGVDHTARDRHAEVSKGYPKGFKGSVDSTAAVVASLSEPVRIRATKPAGNAFNFAVGSAEPSVLLPRIQVDLDAQVGTDQEARMYKAAVEETAVNPRFAEYPGNTSHSYIFPTEDDRVILSESPMQQELPLFKEPETPPGFIYLTSLAGSNWHINYDRIGDYAERNDVLLGVSPGTPQINSLKDTSALGEKQRESLYKTIGKAGILFGNKEEIMKLVNGKGVTAEKDATKLILQAKEVLGCETVSMTNGGEDSMYVDYDDTVFRLPVFKSDKPEQEGALDFTGAGDTYAAGFMRGFLAGESVPDCMRRGAAAAYAVIHETGVPPGFVAKHQVERVLFETAKKPENKAEVVYLDERKKRPLEELAEAS